jgi:putative redox protein
MAIADVTWVDGKEFVATDSVGHSIVLDAPEADETYRGFKPSELLLAAVAGCTGMDVVSILRKQRQILTGVRVRASGVTEETYPRAFKQITITYEFRGRDLRPSAVERAIELSHEKYCMIAATVRGVAEIKTQYTIIDELTEGAQIAVD